MDPDDSIVMVQYRGYYLRFNNKNKDFLSMPSTALDAPVSTGSASLSDTSAFLKLMMTIIYCAPAPQSHTPSFNKPARAWFPLYISVIGSYGRTGMFLFNQSIFGNDELASGLTAHLNQANRHSEICKLKMWFLSEFQIYRWHAHKRVMHPHTTPRHADRQTGRRI